VSINAAQIFVRYPDEMDAAALLALVAAHRNVRVGAVLFTDRVERYIPPKGGQKQAWRIISEMAALRPEGRGTDVAGAMRFAKEQVHSRSMIAMISDFSAPDFTDALAALSKDDDFRPIRVTDPGELRPLPDVGLLRVRDPETGELRWVDTSSARARAEQAGFLRRDEARLETAFAAARARPIHLSTDGDYLEELSAELRPKKTR